MSDEQRTIHDAQGQPHTVTVRRDKRLRKSARWNREPDGSILLRIPPRLPRRQVDTLLTDIARKIDRQQRKAARRTDADLQARAEHLNQTCFGGAVSWQAIRWVGNMEHRLGSCTTGGPTDGHIRISDKIKEWPQWVIDYVIAHELTHRLHPDHSAEFWETLRTAYPDTDRARGFVEGFGFAQGQGFEED